MTLRFASALFASAALMFSVQPMVAKAITPLLGGAPAVWVTCMLFFQALLLLGYVFAHVSLRCLGARRQAMLHVALLALPLLVLPMTIRAEQVAAWPEAADPSLRLLGLLASAIGAPFLVLAASAPLFQGWFAALGSTRDAYRLYVASNLGSVVALAAYPLAIEPLVGLGAQVRAWRAGYVVFAALGAICALSVIRAPSTGAARGEADVAIEPPIGWRRRAAWFALSFVPSLYLVSVTTYITTDVAPIPLFWALPLLLYLVSFILAFARRARTALVRANDWLALGLTVSVVALMLEAVAPAPVHLAAFFLAAVVCHARLAADRPGEARLTEFYLWLSVGGMAGGLVNALVAPALFSSIFEYPLALVLAALCRSPAPAAEPRSEGRGGARPGGQLGWRDVTAPLAVGGVTAGVLFFAPGAGDASLAVRSLVAVPGLANYAARGRSLRFGLGLAAMLLAGTAHTGLHGRTLRVDRNFFGVLRVTEDESGRFHQIVHGNVIHGRQHRAPERRRDPLAYYHREGPLGDVFATFDAELAGRDVAVVGLGAGAIAAYAKPDQRWTFFEINPAVVRVATDPALFTFLADAFPEAPPRIRLGDARLRLAEEPEGAFALLVLDAFSSDAVPTHLLTREALAIDRAKLAPDGLLAFHVSNRYLDLRPVVARAAREAGLAVLARDDLTPSKELLADGLTPSQWLVASPDASRLARLVARGWHEPASGDRDAWTDDYSDVISAYRLWD